MAQVNGRHLIKPPTWCQASMADASRHFSMQLTRGPSSLSTTVRAWTNEVDWVPILTTNTWKNGEGTTNGTMIWRACAVMVISAKTHGEVARITVAVGRSKAQASTAAATTEAITIKNEFNTAKGMNSR